MRGGWAGGRIANCCGREEKQCIPLHGLDHEDRMLRCFRLVLQTHRESLMVQKQGDLSHDMCISGGRAAEVLGAARGRETS